MFQPTDTIHRSQRTVSAKMTDAQRHHPSFALLVITLLLSCIGLVMLYSASSIVALMKMHGDPLYFFKKQVFSFGIGLSGLVFFMNVHYKRWFKLAPLFFIASFILLMLPFLVGKISHGATRWITLGPLSIQPAEIIIVATIFYVSFLFSRSWGTPKIKEEYARSLFVIAINFVVILLQPDLGTATLLLIPSLAVVFSAGIPMKSIIRLAIISIPVFVIAIFTASYRMQRIQTFLNPDRDPNGTGWQIQNSYFALADGGWLGKGLGHSIEKYLYLPEGHTDFIFAVTVEEIGIVRAFAILILFGILIYKGFDISLKVRDPFGKLVAVGLTTAIGFSVFVNIATVTGLIPATGIPLPFFSYGGTSLIFKLWSIGVLLNISRYTEEMI